MQIPKSATVDSNRCLLTTSNSDVLLIRQRENTLQPSFHPLRGPLPYQRTTRAPGTSQRLNFHYFCIFMVHDIIQAFQKYSQKCSSFFMTGLDPGYHTSHERMLIPLRIVRFDCYLIQCRLSTNPNVHPGFSHHSDQNEGFGIQYIRKYRRKCILIDLARQIPVKEPHYSIPNIKIRTNIDKPQRPFCVLWM